MPGRISYSSCLQLTLLLATGFLAITDFADGNAECGYQYGPDQTNGLLVSPNYPFDYQSPLNCSYTFHFEEEDLPVQLCFIFYRFSLSNDSTCHQDYIKFKDIYRYCGIGHLAAGLSEELSVKIYGNVWGRHFCWYTDNPQMDVGFVATSGGRHSGFFAEYYVDPGKEIMELPSCIPDINRYSLQTATRQARDHNLTYNSDNCVNVCRMGYLCDVYGEPTCECYQRHPGETPCAPSEWACFNRKCVNSSLLCDGNNDCGDDSDEMYMHARCPARSLFMFKCCDFELMDTCGLGGLSQWTMQKASDWAESPGPSFDHTRGEAGDGHFLVTLFDTLPPESEIHFYTQDLVVPPEGVCLSFWYYMTGPEAGTLRVTVTKQVIWQISGDLSRDWHSANVYISCRMGSTVRIWMAAIRGRDVDGAIALDDIFLQNGNCTQTTEPACLFEDNACGWHSETAPSKIVSLQWRRETVEGLGPGVYMVYDGRVLPFGGENMTDWDFDEDFDVEKQNAALLSPLVSTTRVTEICYRLAFYLMTNDSDFTIFVLPFGEATNAYVIFDTADEATWEKEWGQEWREWENGDGYDGLDPIATRGVWHLVEVPGVVKSPFMLAIRPNSSSDVLIAIDNASIVLGSCNPNDTAFSIPTSPPTTTASSFVWTGLDTCEEGYLCQTHDCVEMALVCDGKSDCLDGSDEMNCHDPEPPDYTTTTPGNSANVKDTSSRSMPGAAAAVIAIVVIVLVAVFSVMTAIIIVYRSKSRSREREEARLAIAAPPAVGGGCDIGDVCYGACDMAPTAYGPCDQRVFVDHGYRVIANGGLGATTNGGPGDTCSGDRDAGEGDSGGRARRNWKRVFRRLRAGRRGWRGTAAEDGAMDNYGFGMQSQGMEMQPLNRHHVIIGQGDNMQCIDRRYPVGVPPGPGVGCVYAPGTHPQRGGLPEEMTAPPRYSFVIRLKQASSNHPDTGHDDPTALLSNESAVRDPLQTLPSNRVQEYNNSDTTTNEDATNIAMETASMTTEATSATELPYTISGVEVVRSGIAPCRTDVPETKMTSPSSQLTSESQTPMKIISVSQASLPADGQAPSSNGDGGDAQVMGCDGEVMECNGRVMGCDGEVMECNGRVMGCDGEGIGCEGPEAAVYAAPGVTIPAVEIALCGLPEETEMVTEV